MRDFFDFLKVEPDKDYYLALGSNQQVQVKARFQPKATKAYNRCLEAIADEGKAAANKKWRELFGTSLPLKASESARSFDDIEEFIEDKYPVDIVHSVTIDCQVTQDGWRKASLLEMLRNRTLLRVNKDLTFKVTSCTVAHPYEMKWKVLNRGEVAVRRNNIRGQIIGSSQPNVRNERTTFRGEHVVECFVVKDGVVVARNRIDVPISS
ncbi:nucleotide-binding domain-containing protein [Glutamicibacter sp. AOP5-A2-7]